MPSKPFSSFRVSPVHLYKLKNKIIKSKSASFSDFVSIFSSFTNKCPGEVGHPGKDLHALWLPHAFDTLACRRTSYWAFGRWPPTLLLQYQAGGHHQDSHYKRSDGMVSLVACRLRLEFFERGCQFGMLFFVNMIYIYIYINNIYLSIYIYK